MNLEDMFMPKKADQPASTDHAEVLTMFAQITDQWITLSLAVRDGKITAQEAVNKFDIFMVPVTMILLVANEAGVIDIDNL